MHLQILTVDDEPETGHFLAELLAKQGHIPGVLTSPSSLAQELSSQQHDVVLLDLLMPVSDGLTLIPKTWEVSTNTEIPMGSDKQIVESSPVLEHEIELSVPLLASSKGRMPPRCAMALDSCLDRRCQ